MSRPNLADAFGHHIWASLRVIDACLALTPAQLETTVPGTFGSILDTVRHLVGADRSYLELLSGGAVERIDEEAMDLPALRAVMAENGPVWTQVVSQPLDADQVLTRHRADGSSTSAPLGIRLAQVIHHGTDHRSQIATALTPLGVTPPEIDVWDYAAADGRLNDTPPTA
jgi:uncharacterized damage-inducible protein DinB